MLALLHFWLVVPQVVLTLWYRGRQNHQEEDEEMELRRAFLSATNYVAAIQRGVLIVEPVFVLMMLDKI